MKKVGRKRNKHTETPAILTASMPQDLKDKVSEYCTLTDTPVSNFIRGLIREFFNESTATKNDKEN